MAEREKKIVFNVFRNNRKEKESHPDRKGGGAIPISYLDTLNEWADSHEGIDEIPIDVAGWIRQDKNGNDYMFTIAGIDEYRANRESPKSRSRQRSNGNRWD